MNWLLLISSSLDAMLGAALLMLWRRQRQQAYVRLWGWSWILLAGGLAVGTALNNPQLDPLRHAVQALVAAVCVMGSLFFQIGGARGYRGLMWKRRVWAPVFAAMMLSIVGLASIADHWAILAAAVYLAAGAWACAYWLYRGGTGGERFVGLCFMAVGLVHLSGPLLNPLSQSPITHSAGLMVQTLLCLALMLLAVTRADEEARRQAVRFSQLAGHSLQGLVVIRHQRILYANPAALKMFGYTELPGDLDTLDTLMSEAERAASLARHMHVLSDREATVEWDNERLTRDGRVISVHSLSSHLEWDGAPAELMVMVDDTQRQRAVEALRRQALHDDLTELPNRNFAMERLRERCESGQGPFALLSADLDRFQLVNESLGHEAGDALLRAIARRLFNSLPSDVVLARLGEDQFVVIAPGRASPEQAQALAEQMLGLLAVPFSIEDAELFVHMSIGLALYPRDGSDAATLLRAADAAMHRAKATPGASTQFFDAAMKRSAQTRLDVEQSLGRAIAAGEFRLEYQPKFRAGSRALCGFEALARWQRSDGSRVSPADFIPAAERTGQIKALGDQVLTLACAQISQWRQRFGHCPPVAVNVSPLQFDDPGFVQRFLARLAQHGLPPGSLEIEITETAAMGHIGRVLSQLSTLREAGVACALDDFGTGQSSLTMLRQLPIATMKLDRSMIDPLPRADASAVVQASCVMGRSLGLEIVAEGVETEEQAAAAERLGCTQLQGYLLARPLPAEAAAALLLAALSPASPRQDGSPRPAAMPG